MVVWRGRLGVCAHRSRPSSAQLYRTLQANIPEFRGIVYSLDCADELNNLAQVLSDRTYLSARISGLTVRTTTTHTLLPFCPGTQNHVQQREERGCDEVVGCIVCMGHFGGGCGGVC